MKTWLPRIWAGALFLLVLLAIPDCMSGDGLMNWTGKQSTFDPKGPLAAMQLDVFYVTLWVTTFLFIAVGGTMCLALWKFRVKKGDDPNEIPAQAHGHPMVEFGLIAVSSALLVVIAIPTFAGIMMMKKLPKELEADAIEITVTGYQWWFDFNYTDEGFHSSNELVFPAGRAVKLKLIAHDVLHSFWLPKLSGKTDLIAGRENEMWIMADEEGYFWGQCAEYCGDAHAYMLFRARALSEEDYAIWVKQQKSATVKNDGSFAPVHIPEDSDPALVARGTEIFKNNCARCHSVDSATLPMGAPNLSHFASRSSIAAGWYENEWEGPDTNEPLKQWILDPESVKPGTNMWRGFMNTDGRTVQMAGLDHAGITDSDADALIAYLYTLRAADALLVSKPNEEGI